MRCENFLKVHKNTGEKIFAKDLSADGCFVKTNKLYFNKAVFLRLQKRGSGTSVFL